MRKEKYSMQSNQLTNRGIKMNINNLPIREAIQKKRVLDVIEKIKL